MDCFEDDGREDESEDDGCLDPPVTIPLTFDVRELRRDFHVDDDCV